MGTPNFSYSHPEWAVVYASQRLGARESPKSIAVRDPISGRLSLYELYEERKTSRAVLVYTILAIFFAAALGFLVAMLIFGAN